MKNRTHGLPGAPQYEQEMDPQLQTMLLAGTKPRPLFGAFRSGPDEDLGGQAIGDKEISEAIAILTKYKQGKSHLEQRVVEDEQWWKLRHWEVIRNKNEQVRGPEPSSAWLFNSILNKHADAMDNYPEPVVLPRELSDEQSAKTLTSVLPVLLETNAFQRVYWNNWWEKLKHGTAVYGVFWNPQKENGLGDIDIRSIDLLKIFWEPGITDIQESDNLFIVDLVDEKILNSRYPEHTGKLGGGVIDVKQYIYDDAVDTQGKSVVVDWYYKRQSPSGRTVLHYAKFVGSTLLFASENEPEYRDRGWYDHGLYPVVLDVLFPEKGTPVGFGYVAICKDPQLYIDKLSANILENALVSTKKRFFVSENTAVNEEEFLDTSAPLVHVAGELDEHRIREIVTQPVSDIYVSLLQMKIEEMKDTAGNRDVNSGGTGSGVTAAAAIAALQEAGNKSSRDMISASYQAYIDINSLCIELIRQFYDENRSFRITGEDGGYQFMELNNAALCDQPVGSDSGDSTFYRRPVFDLKIRAQKRNPFSRMEQNERAKELYAAGFFNPERAQEALGALEMMDFEGIDKVRDQVRQGQTLLNLCKIQQKQLQGLYDMIDKIVGSRRARISTAPKQADPAQQSTPSAQPTGSSGGIADRMNRSTMEAHTPPTPYMMNLAERSTPSAQG